MRPIVVDYQAFTTKLKMTWPGNVALRSSEESVWICPEEHQWRVLYSGEVEIKEVPDGVFAYTKLNSAAGVILVPRTRYPFIISTETG